MSRTFASPSKFSLGWMLVLFLLAPVVATASSTSLLEVNDAVSGDTVVVRRAAPRFELDRLEALPGVRRIDSPSGVTILVESIGVSGDVATDLDNDYLRIANGIAAAVLVGNGTTVRLVGTFDWTEPFAHDDWVAGDYGILMPGGASNITITASTLGSAVIQGPGELPDVYYEGFLYGWGATYQGWTISNLDVRGFEWTIGFFYDGGSGGTVNDFDGLSIVGNRIEIPTDASALAAGNPDESFQNIGIHLGFGDHQTIANNEFVLAGDGLSDSGNAAFAASVVLQSNSSGGAYEDGLSIHDNLIRVTGAQSADPEYVYGIWENFSAHTSGMTVSGNHFVNEDPGNDPAANLQLGFRITSHSSVSTTVLYENNDVTGAHTGIGWLKYSSPYNPPASVEPVVVRGNTPSTARPASGSAPTMARVGGRSSTIATGRRRPASRSRTPPPPASTGGGATAVRALPVAPARRSRAAARSMPRVGSSWGSRISRAAPRSARKCWSSRRCARRWAAPSRPRSRPPR